MKRGFVFALVAACGGKQASPAQVAAPIAAISPDDPLPGQQWITPLAPWRLAHAGTVVALAPNGQGALVGGDRGRVTRYDLRSGRATASLKLPTQLPIKALVALDSERWLVVAQSEEWAHKHARLVFVVRGFDKLAAEPVTLPAAHDKPRESVQPARTVGYADAAVALLADGNVIIAGTELPLASYDTHTWKRATVLDAELGWTHVQVAGDNLVADRMSSEWRFALKLHDRARVAGSSNGLTSEGTILERTRAPNDKHEVFVKSLEPDVAIVSIGTVDDAIADPHAPRLLVADGKTLTVRTLAGDITRTLSLGTDQTAPLLASAAWMGDRVAFLQAGMLRVVDIGAGTITPIGDSPYTAAPINATDDGHVLGHKFAEVWEIAGARRIHHLDLPAGAAAVFQVGNPRQIIVRDGAHVGLWDPAVPTNPVAHWDFDDDRKPADAYAAHDGKELDYELEPPEFGKPIVGYRWAVGDKQQADNAQIYSRRWESIVQDYSADTHEGLIELDGNVAVLRDGRGAAFQLHYPGCADQGVARLDETSPRAVTWAGNTIAVWDRGNGALLGAVKLASEVQHVAFLKGQPAIVVGTAESITVWSPGVPNAPVRARATADVEFLAASPDGRYLAIHYGDSRTALVEVAPFIAGLPVVGKLAHAEIPTTCGPQDPLAYTPGATQEPTDDEDCYDCGD